MSNFWHKDYYVMFERNPNGSIRAICDSDSDRFGVTFYDYTMTKIKNRIKRAINDRRVTA